MVVAFLCPNSCTLHKFDKFTPCTTANNYKSLIANKSSFQKIQKTVVSVYSYS